MQQPVNNKNEDFECKFNVNNSDMNNKAEEIYLLQNIKPEGTWQGENHVERMSDPLGIENDKLQADSSEHNIKQETCDVGDDKEDVYNHEENFRNNINLYYVKERVNSDSTDTHSESECVWTKLNRYDYNEEDFGVEVKEKTVDIYSESECTQRIFNKYNFKDDIFESVDMSINNENISDESESAYIEESDEEKNYIELTTVRTFESCYYNDILRDNASIADFSQDSFDASFGTLHGNVMQEIKQQPDSLNQCSNVSEWIFGDDEHETLVVKEEVLQLSPLASCSESDVSSDGSKGKSVKSWSKRDMKLALDALRIHKMGLPEASRTYGIPCTTLWQRARRMGIDFPKRGEWMSRSWTEENLKNALEALRSGKISANKASKEYRVPSSTLYKIARKEGIKLAVPFNAAPTKWSVEDLEHALEAIRSGQATVQNASVKFGIPVGTLYGRCKKKRIEVSRNPAWSEDIMNEALEAVRVGQMSINQASSHYNLPYSSLYCRVKRLLDMSK